MKRYRPIRVTVNGIFYEKGTEEYKDGEYVEWVDVAELRHELWEWFYGIEFEEMHDKEFRKILNNIGE